MPAIQTVHCPVDFSPATPRQVGVAADICRAFGARLVLHHNRPALGTAASVGWMWQADHHGDPEQVVEERLRTLIADLAAGVDVEAHVTEGPNGRMVLSMIEAVEADLVILSTHGASTDDHTSITEQVLATGRQSVLALHDETVEHQTPHFASAGVPSQTVLVPTDLSAESAAAVDLGIDLTRRLPVELHLLHVLPRDRGHRREVEAAQRTALERLAALVPDDVTARARLHVETGDPVESIVTFAERLSASCIVMGEHPRARLWRWLSRDTARGVLHRAPCPIWYAAAGRGQIATSPRETTAPARSGRESDTGARPHESARE